MFNSTKHAEERIEKRYKDLTKRDLFFIARAIELKKSYAKLLCIESIDRSMWKVFYEYRWVNVVYNKTTKTIVTVLPGFLRADYIKTADKERFITTKQEINFDIPKEWLKD